VKVRIGVVNAQFPLPIVRAQADASPIGLQALGQCGLAGSGKAAEKCHRGQISQANLT